MKKVCRLLVSTQLCGIEVSNPAKGAQVAAGQVHDPKLPGEAYPTKGPFCLDRREVLK
jgi:hypothetical protein